ncbi:hypothetical protein D1872_262670 [compost metagenome]
MTIFPCYYGSIEKGENDTHGCMNAALNRGVTLLAFYIFILRKLESSKFINYQDPYRIEVCFISNNSSDETSLFFDVHLRDYPYPPG